MSGGGPPGEGGRGCARSKSLDRRSQYENAGVRDRLAIARDEKRPDERLTTPNWIATCFAGVVPRMGYDAKDSDEDRRNPTPLTWGFCKKLNGAGERT